MAETPLSRRNRGPLMSARVPDHPPQAQSCPGRAAAVVASLAGRFARLAAAADATLSVPATPAWTVQDVAAHLITTIDRYARGPAGGMERADPATLPALNDTLLRQQHWPALPELLGQLPERTRQLLDQVEGYGNAQPSYLFNADQPIRADQALGILAGELAVHGGDIAAATGQPWPVTAADTEVILDSLENILPGWVRPERTRGHCATYDIHVRGSRNRHAWAFEEGRLDCHAQPGRPFDCHLSVSPASMLMVMYRRQPAWQAALQGRALAWGRRPWLALTLAGRFHLP